MLVFNNISIRVAGRLLIDEASAQIPAGARVGFVGRNGTGKTTLFRAITGEMGIESGAIELPKRFSLGRMAQEAPGGPESLLDVVLAADTERAKLLEAAESATDPQRIADIQTRLSDIAAHSAPARAAAILAGLGFDAEAQLRPCSEFSGGWRMRVALAAALFAEPDVLLLDEPTNYLDLEGALWLEAHLARYPRTVIIISHDRDLLDRAVDWIMHLDRGKLTMYRGNYANFERQRRERQILDAKQARQRDLQRKHLQSFVDRFRAKASKAKQAQSRVKMLAKLEPSSARIADEVPPISMPDPERTLSPPIIALENVAIGYEPDRHILDRLSLRIDEDDRIALLGANGNGKSTFAKLIAGRLAPMQGRVTRAEKLAVGYFAQHQLDELNPRESAYDHFRELIPDASMSAVRARVGALGFPGARADTPAGELSGGEKARLLLGLATIAKPHLVILDEPTNHLDIDSRAALIEALNGYAGAVILISHDRHLLEACVDRLWIVREGTVAPFEGDMEEYSRLIVGGRRDDKGSGAQANKPPALPRESRDVTRRAAAGKRAELAPLRKRISNCESEIARLTADINRIEATLADGDLFAREPDKAAQLSKRRADAIGALQVAESAWLDASAQYEAEMGDSAATLNS